MRPSHRTTSLPGPAQSAAALMAWILVALLLGGPARGDEAKGADPFPVKAKASADKAAIKVGERLTYTISIEAEGDMIPALPDLPEKLGEFAVLNVTREPPVLGPDGKTRAQVTCLLTSYEVGKQSIPATEVRYKLKDGRTGTVSTKDVPVEVESVLAPEEKMEDIRDIREILAFVATVDALTWIVGFILVVLVLLVGATLIARMRREKVPPPRILTAQERALVRLEELRASGLIAAGRVQEFFYRLSDIARLYIEERFRLRAPERTTEEFLIEMSGTDRLDPLHKSLLGDFLVRCDLVKFARHSPPRTEIEGAVAAVERFVVETRERPERRMEKPT